jgi:small conductance mechanosensitive channel
MLQPDLTWVPEHSYGSYMKSTSSAGRYLQYLLLGLLICLGLLGPMAVGQAQTPDRILQLKPYGLTGSIAYAPIRMDGYYLFSIAAERRQGEGGQSGLGPLQNRRNRIEDRLRTHLQYLLDHEIDPASLQVVTTRLNQQMAVQLILAGNPSQPLVTVTSLDAELYGLSETELAEEYARQIRQGLVTALEERQPAARQLHLRQAVLGGAIAVLLMALLYGWEYWIGQVRRGLRQQFHQQQETLTQQQIRVGLGGGTTQEGAELQQRLFDLKRRIDQQTWRKRCLELLLVAVGTISFAWILQRFPHSRSLGMLLFRQPMGLLLIGLTVTLIIILSHHGVDWFLSRWVGTTDQFSDSQLDRRRRRSHTFSPIWKQAISLFWAIAGLLLAYSLFSLSTGLTLFAGVGALGVIASLVFQSSIKDALAGLMLLTRDAFTLGDLIAVREMVGVVETMGLMITQIRSSAGELITLRNGDITTVANRSKDWSRMDFTVLVDHGTDLQRALAVMAEVLQAMQADPAWQAQFIGEPDILAVEQFQPHGILLKLRTQTQPGQQLPVTREFQLRLHQAFQQAGLRIAVPQQEVRFKPRA